MEVEDLLPGLLGGFGVAEELEVLVRDHAAVGEKLEVDHLRPIVATEQDDRHRLHAVRLPQGERLEHLIERTEAAWKEHDSGGPQDEVKLSQCKILELKAEFRRDERIGLLLAGQLDVEADRLASDIEGTTVGRFHDARPAAGDDHVVTLVVALVVDRHESGKLTSRIVIAAVGEELFCSLELTGKAFPRCRRNGG